MGNSGYLLILLIGAVIVIVDGQLIFRKSPAYLDEVYQNPGRSRQVSGLVTVLFHLVMLGLVALVASIGLAENPSARSVIARVGVLLLLTALGHAGTMSVLSRLRDQQQSTRIAEATVEAHIERDGEPPKPPAPRVGTVGDTTGDGHVVKTPADQEPT